MKKLIMMFAFLGVFSLGAQAQKCAKTCTKAKTTVSSDIVVDDAQIAKLASMDETIERRQCQKSGAVSYFQKNTCAKSGKVSYAEVAYDANQAKFVNVSPKDMGAAKMDEAGSMNVSGTVNKATTSAKKKACCSGKKAASCGTKTAGKAMKASSSVQKVREVAAPAANQ